MEQFISLIKKIARRYLRFNADMTILQTDTQTDGLLALCSSNTVRPLERLTALTEHDESYSE